MFFQEHLSIGEVEANLWNYYHKYNGVINTFLKAKRIIFTYDPLIEADGTSISYTGDIMFNVPRIYQFVNEDDVMFPEVIILYTVLHELSHMDQKIDKKRYKKDKEYYEKIENANENRTFLWMYRNTPLYVNLLQDGKLQAFRKYFLKFEKDFEKQALENPFQFLEPEDVYRTFVNILSGDTSVYDKFDYIGFTITSKDSDIDLDIKEKEIYLLKSSNPEYILDDYRKIFDFQSYLLSNFKHFKVLLKEDEEEKETTALIEIKLDKSNYEKKKIKITSIMN